MPLGTCKSKVVPLAIEVLQSAAAAYAAVVVAGPATALVASLCSADPALPQSQSQSKSPSQVRAGL